MMFIVRQNGAWNQKWETSYKQYPRLLEMVKRILATSPYIPVWIQHFARIENDPAGILIPRCTEQEVRWLVALDDWRSVWRFREEETRTAIDDCMFRTIIEGKDMARTRIQEGESFVVIKKAEVDKVDAWVLIIVKVFCSEDLIIYDGPRYKHIRDRHTRVAEERAMALMEEDGDLENARNPLTEEDKSITPDNSLNPDYWFVDDRVADFDDDNDSDPNP